LRDAEPVAEQAKNAAEYMGGEAGQPVYAEQFLRSEAFRLPWCRLINRS